MIAILLTLAALQAAADPAPLGTIPRQQLPAKGCAAYLWAADRRFVAMAGAEAGSIRLSIDGRVADYARVGPSAGGSFGFAETTRYAGGDVTATLGMTIAPRADMTGGAAVTAATLTIDRTGRDSVVVPLAGLIGCAAA